MLEVVVCLYWMDTLVELYRGNEIYDFVMGIDSIVLVYT